MKIVIFGASGSLGRHLVEQGLGLNHQVTAFARHPNATAVDHPRLRPVAADVYDKDAVAEAVKDQEAVLIALGAGRSGGVRSAGTGNIVEAMQQRGVRRLICLSTLGAGDSHTHLNFFWKRIMFGLLLRDAFADHQRQEDIVKDSGLDWTLVRPGAFTDGPATGRYKHGFTADEKNLQLKISRADVAGFMLRQLSDDVYTHRAVGLSY